MWGEKRMIVKTLVENTSVSEKLSCEHGLSLYIETSKHKILFDTGASGIFAENAEKMNVDLAQVDIAFISHGHYDHGGGLPTFLKLNSKANIYMTEKALNNYTTKTLEGNMAYIGLPKDLEINKRFRLVGDRLIIDDELQLFSNVKGTSLTPSGNASLYMEKEGVMVSDDFSHEQNLIIEDQGKTLLVAGCAHKGIVNIMESIHGLSIKKPDYVIGGFHLYSRSKNENEDPKIVKQIGFYLKSSGPKYYTCHCTGIESFKTLKKIMSEKVGYLATGSELVINENGDTIMEQSSS